VVGNPAKIVKDVSDEMLAWKTEGTALYQALPARLHGTLEACEPLRELPADRAQQQMSYRTWRETKS
jgi:phenylacetic acid degradation protein